MSRRHLLTLTITALAFGGVIAMIPGDRQRASVDLWLVGFGAWAGLGLFRAAMTTTPRAKGRLQPPVRFRRRPRVGEAPVPGALVELRGSVQRSLHNARAFEHRLRPKLAVLAEHRLRIEHGVDLATEPDRARQLLGETAWLIGLDPVNAGATPADGESVSRSPTRSELAGFLDRLEPDHVSRPDRTVG